MSKIKIDARVENAMNAFFETKTDPGNFALTYTGNETALVANQPSFAEKADKWSGILREIFLFGPGTFLLFYLTLAAIFFYPEIGFRLQILLMIAVPAFLTYAGSGTLKQTKNLAVPATIIAMAVAVAVVSSLFSGKLQAEMYFWYSIYFFPIVLIAGKLVQIWVADKK